MYEQETSHARKDLLVVIESVNFNGGAHIATWAMIDALVAVAVLLIREEWLRRHRGTVELRSSPLSF